MTRETFAAILLVLACLSALWAFLGLWKARLVLWWAVPEKQTRGRAFAFGVLLGATLLATVLFLAPQSPWWLCLTAAVGLLLLLCMLSFFRSTEEELRQQLQEHEKEKEKRRRQKEEPDNSGRNRKKLANASLSTAARQTGNMRYLPTASRAPARTGRRNGATPTASSVAANI